MKKILQSLFEPKKKFQIGFKETVVMLNENDLKKIDFLFNNI